MFCYKSTNNIVVIFFSLAFPFWGSIWKSPILVLVNLIFLIFIVFAAHDYQLIAPGATPVYNGDHIIRNTTYNSSKMVKNE